MVYFLIFNTCNKPVGAGVGFLVGGLVVGDSVGNAVGGLVVGDSVDKVGVREGSVVLVISILGGEVSSPGIKSVILGAD